MEQFIAFHDRFLYNHEWNPREHFTNLKFSVQMRQREKIDRAIESFSDLEHCPLCKIRVIKTGWYPWCSATCRELKPLK